MTGVYILDYIGLRVKGLNALKGYIWDSTGDEYQGHYGGYRNLDYDAVQPDIMPSQVGGAKLHCSPFILAQFFASSANPDPQPATTKQ